MWTCIVVSLLWMGLARCTEKAATPALMEYTPADFNKEMLSGKTMFIYFQQKVSSDMSHFLGELQQSSEALQPYGVLVAKVNCSKEPVYEYCEEEKAQLTFLFRGGKESSSFDLNTMSNVNAIVSEVLFIILEKEIKYVQTVKSLVAFEKKARGKKDIALCYTSRLRTPAHRSLLETAYVYGSKYQFIFITGGPVLENLGVDEQTSLSKFWFLHCAGAPSASTRCPSVRMRKPVSTLNLHAFLQFMEAPLVTEVYEDPASVQRAPFPYQDTPQVFLFSRPATQQQDLDAASALAWGLRGFALMVLVHRQSPDVKTPDEYNAAYRLSEKGSEVKYLHSNNPDELLALLTSEDEEAEEEEEEDWQEGDTKDSTDDTSSDDTAEDDDELNDEIASSVYKNQDKLPDPDSLAQLTSDNFHASVAQSSLTVALFYLPWHAVSKTFIGSYVDVAERLEGSEVQVSVVNCAEWSDLCAAESGSSPPMAFPFQPVTVYPTVLLLRPEEPAQRYGGMLSAEALHRFIALSRPASLVLLSTQEEVTSFLQEVPPAAAGYKPDRALGLFKTGADAGVRSFTEAAKSLRGEVLTGLLTGGLAEEWAAKHNVQLPVVLVFPSWGTHTRPAALLVSTVPEELLSHINTALLHPLPELTVENLPSFLSLGKGLLLLFLGEEEDETGRKQSQALLEELRGVVEQGGKWMQRYLVCWIHLGRTPAGTSVLGSYLGSAAPLPALVLTHLPTGSEIYQYPPDTPVVASSVLEWVQRVEDGTESAAGMLGGDSWPPATELYNFLDIIDEEEPNNAKQKTFEGEEDGNEEEEDEEEAWEPSSVPAPVENHHTEL